MIKSVKYIIALLVTAFLSPAAFSANYDVGPGAAYATIQAGIDAALTAGGTNTVRVQTGTYNENISSINGLVAGKSLELSGGWDGAYATQNTDPAVTIIDGSTGQVFNITTSGGTFIMHYFTITNGGSVAIGAGMNFQADGATTVTLENMIFSNNHATSAVSSVLGGGLFFIGTATSTLLLQNSVITGNSVNSDTFDVTSGGLYIDCQDSVQISLLNNQILNNTATSNSNQATSAGIYVGQSGACSGTVQNNLVSGNTTAGTGSVAFGPGAQFILFTGATGSMSVNYNRFLNNIDSKNNALAQVELISSNTGSIIFSDAIIANSNRGGLVARAYETSTIKLANLTVADNTGREGIIFNGPGTKTVYNSIVQGNQTDALSIMGSAPTTGNNIIGIDPYRH